MTQAIATPTASPLDRIGAQMVAFVEHFANTGDERLAAIEAGCHPNRARQFARVAMNAPTVKAAYEHVLRTMSRTEAELANRAKMASVAPDANQFDTQVIDMEG